MIPLDQFQIVKLICLLIHLGFNSNSDRFLKSLGCFLTFKMKLYLFLSSINFQLAECKYHSWLGCV